MSDTVQPVPDSPPRVCAVVINWNRPLDTAACLRSLARSTYSPMSTVLVDNGSRDDSVPRLRAEFPDLDIICNPDNRGFGAAANQALDWARAHGAAYVFLLNNDATVAPDAMERLMETAVRPDVGAVAPLVLCPGSEDRIWSAGSRRNRATLGEMDTRRGRRWRAGDPRRLARDYLYGCALVLNLRALERTGGFDERFFMYSEDLDLCLRLQTAGYVLWLDSAARVWHEGAASSGGRESAWARYWSAHSLIHFFRKHARGAQWLAIIPWRLFSTVRITVCLLAAGRPSAAHAFLRGLRAGFRDSGGAPAWKSAEGTV